VVKAEGGRRVATLVGEAKGKKRTAGGGTKLVVEPGPRGGGVGNVRGVGGEEHAAGDAGCEGGDLAADVAQERVACPAADQHDGEDGDAGEVHGHGGPGADGVCANLGGAKPQEVLAQLRDTLSQVLEHVVGGGELEPALYQDGIDWGVGCGGGVAEDPVGDGRPGEDGTEGGVAGASHHDGVLPPVVFLECEGERDVVGLGNGGVREAEGGGAADELEVAEAEARGAPGRTGHGKVLAGPEGKEERPDGQLGECPREVGRRFLGEMPEDAGRYGALLVFAGVSVGVAAELGPKKAVQSEGACVGGARTAVCPVGRHHSVEGVAAGSGGAGGSVAESGESTGAVGVEEGAEDSRAVGRVEGREEWVVAEVHEVEEGLEEGGEAVPLGVGGTGDGALGGSACSRCVMFKESSGGRGKMAKFAGTCVGKRSRMVWVRMASEETWSRERASATPFWVPAIHCGWTVAWRPDRSWAMSRARRVRRGGAPGAEAAWSHWAAARLSVPMRMQSKGRMGEATCWNSRAV